MVTSTKLKIVHRVTTLVKNMTKPINKVVQGKQDPNNTTNRKRTQIHKIISQLEKKIPISRFAR